MDNMHIEDLIAMSGGFKEGADVAVIDIFRRVSDGNFETISKSIKRSSTNNLLIYENKDFYLTESPIDYGTDYNTATNNLTTIQTTSLLNTPYFTNAILKGVSGETNQEVNPYVGLGYIYLNSLPLPTLSLELF